MEFQIFNLPIGGNKYAISVQELFLNLGYSSNHKSLFKHKVERLEYKENKDFVEKNGYIYISITEAIQLARHSSSGYNVKAFNAIHSSFKKYQSLPKKDKQESLAEMSFVIESRTSNVRAMEEADKYYSRNSVFDKQQKWRSKENNNIYRAFFDKGIGPNYEAMMVEWFQKENNTGSTPREFFIKHKMFNKLSDLMKIEDYLIELYQKDLDETPRVRALNAKGRELKEARNE